MANFADFLDAKPAGDPFCFWYGGYEAHRGYDYGSGLAGGKSLADVERLPVYLPDNESVRTDLLDYAREVDHFDTHLVRMLQTLEDRGELEDTLVVVTADNGASFPRVKSHAYDASNHLPLATMWKRGIENPGRTVDAYVSFIDFAPTFVELAGLTWEQTGMAPTPGRSLSDLFQAVADRPGPARDHVLIGKERHDVGRPHDVGYPIRGIVKGDLLYLRNFEPSRWPAGNPETGYLATDGGPTKTAVLDGRTDPRLRRFWELCFGKRPAEEVYNLSRDPDCVNNLAEVADYADQKRSLSDQLARELAAQGDPRISGNGEVFDRYPYADEAMRNFYERYTAGEKLRPDWVNEADFEEGPLE